MSCVNPQNIYAPYTDENGFTAYRACVVPCGKCPMCLQARAREWSLRCMQEASQYEHNCFITLTYDNEHLPEHGSLVKEHPRAFLKRLRRRHDDVTIRYFGCGEYGSHGLRPHYHIILFNFDFSDKYAFRRSSRGELLYRSDELESLWTFGFSSIGEVTEESTRYCAKYLQKLQEPPAGCIPSYTYMSLKPGIGFNAVSESAVESGCYYVDGQRYNIPRYYCKVLERQGVCLDEYKSLKMASAIAYANAQPSRFDADYERVQKLFQKGIDK